MAMKFAKPSFMLWEGNAITDHNRGEVEISPERIERSKRMANGTLRKYVVADKRKFSVSWEMVPSKSRYTVDGFWGAEEIESWWNSIPGAFTLTLNYSEGLPVNYEVVMTSFSKTLSKRGLYDMYNVSVELEEV